MITNGVNKLAQEPAVHCLKKAAALGGFVVVGICELLQI
jgi:hypothetical protein